MALMDEAQLEGYLTRDPELHHTQRGTSVTTFALANDRVYYDRDHNKQQRTDYPIVTLWGRQADILYKYAGKGSLISVVGRNITRSYQNKNGNTVYMQGIMAHRNGMELLSTKRPHHNSSSASKNPSSSASNTSSDSSSSAQASSSMAKSASSGSSDLPKNSDIQDSLRKFHISDDDLPF